MTMRVRRTILSMFVAGIVLLLPHTVDACSKVPVSIQRWSRNTVLFVGVAQADTMLAGAGTVGFTVAPGHFGRAGTRSIFGQVVSVESLPSVDRKLLPRETTRVLLVPWDYGADCRPTPWMRSAQWIPSGTRGIYNAQLRERTAWVNDIPTLDVMSPAFTPYTGKAGRYGEPDSMVLSVDELFPVIDVMPDPQVMSDDPARAVEPFLTWVRANREVLERSPINMLHFETMSWARDRAFARIESPLLGTYRFTVSIPGHTDRVFFGRTGAKPYYDWYWRRSDKVTTDPTTMQWAVGYFMLVQLATNADSLSDRCAPKSADVGADIAHADSGGVRVWRGFVDMPMLTAMFPADTALVPYAESWSKGFAARQRTHGDAPARFTMRSGGLLQLHAEFPLDENRRVVLRGERISRDVSRCGVG